MTKTFVILATLVVAAYLLLRRSPSASGAQPLDAGGESVVQYPGSPSGIFGGLISQFSSALDSLGKTVVTSASQFGNFIGAGTTTSDASAYDAAAQQQSNVSGTKSAQLSTQTAQKLIDQAQKEIGAKVYEVTGQTVGEQLRNIIIDGRSAENVVRQVRRETPGPRLYTDIAGNVYSSIHDAALAARARKAAASLTGISEYQLTVRKDKLLTPDQQSRLRAVNRAARSAGVPAVYYDLRGNAYATAASAAAAIRRQRAGT